MERVEDQVRLGTCGLTRRDGLDPADTGDSLLEQYEGQGYTCEGTQAVSSYGFKVHKLEHIEAMTAQQTQGSLQYLKKIGMHYKKMIH